MNNRSVFRASASAFALFIGGIAAPTLAQQTAASGVESDIIVTARRTNERLQDVPVAVTVFSAQDLRRQGIDDLMDVAQRTPGFAFEAISPIVVQPAIRGMTNLRTTSPVQNVPINIDGIYLQRGYMVDQSLVELQQIEIIKGPQSALYGRNAFAGVINLTTRAPNLDEIEGEISGRQAGRDGRRRPFAVRRHLGKPAPAGRCRRRADARQPRRLEPRILSGARHRQAGRKPDHRRDVHSHRTPY
jgi:outer membrane receptor protein involved in Fe transport